MEKTHIHYMNESGRNKVHLTEVVQNPSYLNRRSQSSILINPRLESHASGFCYLNIDA